MEVDSESASSPQRELLVELAGGSSIKSDAWAGVRTYITEQLDQICHHTFPIPKLPPPQPIYRPRADSQGRLISPLPSSPTADPEDADKENEPQNDRPASDSAPAVQELVEGQLPIQLQQMLDEVLHSIESFAIDPPHTVQRLAELILQPKSHYKSLASYLHAVDRVTRVTSELSVYPLPPAIPDMSKLNGGDDLAMQVNWSNPVSHQIPVGSDEALGGALLTPIPWLTKRSPESGVEAAAAAAGSNNGGSNVGGSTTSAQIVSEGTETIDGPNGVGSIETVSVSLNGVSSTGATRGITQGELLRQEQRAGVVPMNQLHRAQGPSPRGGGPSSQMLGSEDDDDEDAQHSDDEDEIPHARGPEEIGVDDTGPQTATNSHLLKEGAFLEISDIDVEAAVGRKHDVDEPMGGETSNVADKEENDQRSATPSKAGSGTKREADPEVEGEPVKKAAKDDTVVEELTSEEKKGRQDEDKEDDVADKMDMS